MEPHDRPTELVGRVVVCRNFGNDTTGRRTGGRKRPATIAAKQQLVVVAVGAVVVDLQRNLSGRLRSHPVLGGHHNHQIHILARSLSPRPVPHIPLKG